jgi:hypothetical protein
MKLCDLSKFPILELRIDESCGTAFIYSQLQNWEFLWVVELMPEGVHPDGSQLPASSLESFDSRLGSGLAASRPPSLAWAG